MAVPPEGRNDFEIAIVCALSLEYDVVCELVDEFWDDERYGRAAGDPNTYTTGRIGAFNIVIVLLSGMGKVKAASATASLRSSYPNLELVLVTGICGGVPKTGAGKELVLGDVVISNTVVQYDLGRRYPTEFETKNTLSDSLGRPVIHIQNLVAKLATKRGLQWLEQQAASHLERLRGRQLNEIEGANYEYPGADNDHLYPTSYLHKHRSTELCRECNDDPRAVCRASRKLSCSELGCDVRLRVPRTRLQEAERLRLPRVFIGRFGSGDTVFKSGKYRDRIAKEHDLIAFEMEGAGAWDEIPCIIVKGICDYADSHKNKHWQNFAAATAASVAKALVEKYPRSDRPSSSRKHGGLGYDPAPYSHTPGRTMNPVSRTGQEALSSNACHVLSYDRNENFIPRPDINSKLDQLLPSNSDQFHSAALWGLGGSGKTQIALQYAYNRRRNPGCSVFWVHADTEATFTQDYKTIAGVLGLGTSLKGNELLEAVRRGIESQKRWVLVVDNADDLELFGVGSGSGKQPQTLLDSIPKGPNGTVLWTSRDQRVDGNLVDPQRGIQVAKMTAKEATRLLEKWRRQVTPSDEVREVELLLEELQWLPLAISQAGAYMHKTETSVSEYLSQLKEETGRWRILGEDEFDRHRRSDAQNSVLRTWSISIRRLKQESQTAYRILHVLAFVDNQNIPVELLAAAARYKTRRRDQALKWAARRIKNFPLAFSLGREKQTTKTDLDDLGPALRRLKDFSFMTEHRGEGNRRTFEVHKLVQDAARYGLHMEQSPGQDERYFAKVALQVVDGVYPQDTYFNTETQDDSERYLAHAQRVRGWAENHGMEKEALNLQGRVCDFLGSRGRWEELRHERETNLRLAQKAFGEGHWKSISELVQLGWAFYYLGQPQESEECAKKVMRLAQETLDEEDKIMLECKRLLARTHSEQGRSEQAKQLLMEILDDARQFLDADDDMVLDCMRDLAEVYLDLEEYDGANELLPRLLKLRQDKHGKSHPVTLQVLHLCGSLHYDQGRYDEAVKGYSLLLDLERQSLGHEHPNTLVTLYNLALAQRGLGRKEDAVELMRECSCLRHRVLGTDHPDTKLADKMLEGWEHEDMELDL
ncbi:hypothetical protein ACHAPT_009201 [Fusarium lateritium]